MRRLASCLLAIGAAAALGQIACGVAFDVGRRPAKIPSRFEDVNVSQAQEERRSEDLLLTAGRPSAVVGMSIVVGGSPLDAGPLPKPPIPVVMVP